MGEGEEDQEDRVRISEGGLAAARLTEKRALKEGRDGCRLLEFSQCDAMSLFICSALCPCSGWTDCAHRAAGEVTASINIVPTNDSSFMTPSQDHAHLTV
jgi:hypothetical protein